MEQAFLGTGVAFPPQIDPATGRFKMQGLPECKRIHISYPHDTDNREDNKAGIRYENGIIRVHGCFTYRADDNEKGTDEQYLKSGTESKRR